MFGPHKKHTIYNKVNNAEVSNQELWRSFRPVCKSEKLAIQYTSILTVSWVPCVSKTYKTCNLEIILTLTIHTSKKIFLQSHCAHYSESQEWGTQPTQPPQAECYKFSVLCVYNEHWNHIYLLFSKACSYYIVHLGNYCLRFFLHVLKLCTAILCHSSNILP